jgi:hypothetical protein
MGYQRERVDCTLGYANLENLNVTMVLLRRKLISGHQLGSPIDPISCGSPRRRDMIGLQVYILS